MNSFITRSLSALRYITWLHPDDANFPTQTVKSWLLESNSLSRRLECHCQQLKVTLLRNEMIQNTVLHHDEIKLLSDENCLLRNVILCGDNVPWILGSTLIPNSSMLNQQHNFANQGEKPLGLTVFKTNNAKRDALQVGWITIDGTQLFARRSRLWMNHKPMLVTELFLPASPSYV